MIVCCRKSAFFRRCGKKRRNKYRENQNTGFTKNHICYAWQVFNREGVPIGHIESSLETLVEFFN